MALPFDTRLAAALFVSTLLLPGLAPCCSSGGAEEDIGPDRRRDEAADERAEAGDGGAVGEATPDEFGFSIRIPEEHEVECDYVPEGFPKTIVQAEVDHLCSFDYDGASGHIYVQATPVDCIVLQEPMVAFEVAGAWISFDGLVSPLEDAAYDSGGNHQNDSIEFTYGGKMFTYFHSSFGSGWGKCQPMDCMIVSAPRTEEVFENGCIPERTLPVVCVQVDSDGAYPPLVDTFEPCR